MLEIIHEAKKVFETEIQSLNKVKYELGEEFIALVNEVLKIEGRVILTGMGKSGHIARKISATLSSLGVPSYFLHPAEAAHGDLGMITKEDIVLTMSNSGETDEIIQLIPSIKQIGSRLVSITCNENSTLEKHSDLKIHLKIIQEASPEQLAPTTSTTAMLVFGDALAVVLSKLIGFKSEKFAIFHPKGALGKRLLIKVCDLMHKGEENPTVFKDAALKDAILVMSEKGLGGVSIVNKDFRLIGLITDGDLRRILEKHDHIAGLKVKDFMNQKPVTVRENTLAVDALKLMENREKPIALLLVVDQKNKLLGTIRLVDIVKKGIIKKYDA
ncbi:MAG: KpsF/GutQ family sugar-phosphate isomerase [Marinisporobacter sp.]|jgi:arabinose-5-phosphate isomerase|nr:KpsF/GutQ family sugar-phosphate isomerase [Marinisporobacter sp.]